MSDYKGTIIEESLEDKGVLEKLNIISTKVEKVTDEHQTPWLAQWTLHAVEIPEDKAEAVAGELSKCLDRGHGGSWYVDFRNKDRHYVIYRDKVFHIDRKSREQYDEVRQYGISLGIPEYQLVNYQDLPLDVLAQFLKEANKNTYANPAAKKAASTRPNSEDYHFERENLIYHDTYLGGRDFIGEEIVYQDQKPKWGMNYYGFILDDGLPEKELVVFLRTALMQEYGGVIPVRGPKEFSENGWTYELAVDGDLARFRGQEEIFRDGKAVYRLFLHGGFVQE